MADLPMFSTLNFPENPKIKIQEFDHVVVEDDTRIYFKENEAGKRLGFTSRNITPRLSLTVKNIMTHTLIQTSPRPVSSGVMFIGTG